MRSRSKRVVGFLVVLLVLVGGLVVAVQRDQGTLPVAQPLSGAKAPSPAGLATPVAGLAVYVLSTGEIQIPAAAMIDPAHPLARADEKGGKIWVPNFAYLIVHPTRGAVLVDTGLGAAFATRSNGDLGWFTQPAVHTRVQPGADVASQLRKLGISAPAFVVLTHGHIDHTGGLQDVFAAYGPVDVVVGEGEPDAINAMLSIRKGFKPLHFEGARHLFTTHIDRTSTSSFTSGIDLLGDGSVLLYDTHGHTPGHLAVLVNLAGGPALMVGDAVQTPHALKDGIPSGNCTDPVAALAVARELRALQGQEPRLRVLYGHHRGEPALLDVLH